MEGVCPYCKSKIGGQKHISATGNAQYSRGYAYSAIVKLYCSIPNLISCIGSKFYNSNVHN